MMYVYVCIYVHTHIYTYYSRSPSRSSRTWAPPSRGATRARRPVENPPPSSNNLSSSKNRSIFKEPLHLRSSGPKNGGPPPYLRPSESKTRTYHRRVGWQPAYRQILSTICILEEVKMIFVDGRND